MEHTEIRHEPESVLHLSELDVELVQVLAKYWLITIEQQDNGIVIQLYAKEYTNIDISSREREDKL